MQKLLAVAVAGLILEAAGCMSFEDYRNIQNPSATAADFQRDHYECERDATQQAGPGLANAMERGVRQGILSAQCLLARGWRSKSAQTVPPAGEGASSPAPVAGSSFGNSNMDLFLAANNGDLTQVKSLLSQGADVNAKNMGDMTALCGAVVRGHADVVQVLLEHGADANVQFLNGQSSPIGHAVIMGYADIVQALLAHGADANAKVAGGGTVLYMAAMGHAEIVKALLAHGADVNAKTTNGMTALIMAAQTGHVDIVQILLEHGADVNAKNNTGMTALTIATMQGQADVAAFLSAHGAVATGLPLAVPPATAPATK